MMNNVVSLDEFKKKKELEEEKRIANDLHELLSSLMLDDEPLIVSYKDSSGIHYYDLNNFEDITISDSNPYEK